MTIPPLTSLPSPADGLPAARSGQPDDFRTILAHLGGTSKDPRKQAEDAAAGLVSQALILPILKQVRRSTFNKEGPFSPGTAEKSFGPEFDMQLSDRIARSPQMGVTKALAARLLKRSGIQAAPNAAATQEAIDVHG